MRVYRSRPAGSYSTPAPSTNACAATAGCEHFVFGTGAKAGRCFHELTSSASCPEGWESDLYDFFRLPALPADTWTHVAVVQSRASTENMTGPAKIYWDGVEKAAGELQFPLPVARDNLYVGKSHYASDPMFTGQMRDLLVWDVALSEAELESVIPLPLSALRERRARHLSFTRVKD